MITVLTHLLANNGEVSDANLRRYGITPGALTSAMVCYGAIAALIFGFLVLNSSSIIASILLIYVCTHVCMQMSDPRVQSYCIFIASLGEEVCNLSCQK